MARFRDMLVDWYHKHRRDLPWRRDVDPYAIWVSEIMLQQTRVETVLPYYRRFMERFPTPKALADASEDQVLAHWSGLGYYRRARLLHAGAKAVVEQHGGAVPKEQTARRALPGVGRYTAGAIGSIGFGLPEPIVDGNVARVLCRVHGITTPLGQPDTEKRLWAETEALMAAEAQHSSPEPGALNQALMELGALVCSPKQPNCKACPVERECKARLEGTTDSIPVPKKRPAPKAVSSVAVCAFDANDGLWLRQTREALFGGLWSVPMASGSTLEHAQDALKEAGLAGTIEAQPRGIVGHLLTHRRYRITVFRATGVSKKFGDARVFAASDRAAVGVSKMTEKVIQAALRNHVQETLPLG